MRRMILDLVVSAAIIFSTMTVQAQQESMLLAQIGSSTRRSYIEIGKPSYELTSISTDQTKVAWNVVVSNGGSRYHTLDIHVRFFDEERSQVLEDTLRRVYIRVGEKVTVSHEIITDTSIANVIRTAEASARQRGKAKSAGTSK